MLASSWTISVCVLIFRLFSNKLILRFRCIATNLLESRFLGGSFGFSSGGGGGGNGASGRTGGCNLKKIKLSVIGLRSLFVMKFIRNEKLKNKM